MRQFNIKERLICLIERLYKNAQSAVIINGAIGKFFKTTVGVRQVCLLSPILFNIYLEEIMRVALENYNGSVVIGGKEICNLRFADDIDLIAGTLDEFQLITNKLLISSAAYGMD